MTEKFDLHDTKIWADLQAQSSAGREYSALFTDIDNTWYRPDSPAAVEAAWELRERASAAPYPIIAVTGASFDGLVWPRVENEVLPRPEVVASSVGTSIRFLLTNNRFVKDMEYEQRLQDTGFKRLEVLQAVNHLLPQLHAEGVEISFQEPEIEAAYLESPDPDYQPYKLSMHFFADEAGVRDTAAFFGREFSRFKIVTCEDVYHNATLPPEAPSKKYCLDIVAANKADAVNYIIKKLRLMRGAIGGDSGNDIDMLLDTPKSFIAVAVGGHKAELKAALEAHKAAFGDTHKPIYIDTHPDRLAAQTLLLFDRYLRGEQKEFQL